ncbi:aldo/keto reductase [Eubacteriales bacterium OttesenSCG-928-N14]|nr:aldo/keto reductase [Eubacteriales bacterium OttesenSCG-928-N14]
MRYKRFGNTDIDSSVISIGTWAIGAEGWGDVDKKESIQAVHAMLDNGVNMIDTAPIYGHGNSELVLGEALKNVNRSSYHLITKFGSTWPNGVDAPLVRDNSRENILREIDDSLKRLQTDYIDIYFCHWPDPDMKVPFEETISTMEELRKAGKIRYIGLSNHSIEQIQECMKYGTINAIQPPYSMVNRKFEELLIWATEQNLGTTTYGSLGSGLLTGAIREKPNFSADDKRATFYSDLYSEPKFSQIMELLRTLDAIAAERNVPVAQVAVNWSTQSPWVSTALMGVRNVHEANENCAGTEWMLSEEEYQRINAAIDNTVGK